MWKKRGKCVLMNVGMDAMIWIKTLDRGDRKSQLRTGICIMKHGHHWMAILQAKREIYMCSDVSEQVVRNIYKCLGWSNWLGKPLCIMSHRSGEPALCLPSFSSRHTPAVATSHRSRCRGPGTSWLRAPPRPCAFLQPHAPHANVPPGPGDHPRPSLLGDSPHSSSARCWDLRPSRPHHLAPLMPLRLTPLMALTLTSAAHHVHLLSALAPYDWQEVIRQAY